tara:strand:- start:796 stop:918 length:123 start_codon:yes stop_codon:yes gene_type:complete
MAQSSHNALDFAFEPKKMQLKLCLGFLAAKPTFFCRQSIH